MTEYPEIVDPMVRLRASLKDLLAVSLERTLGIALDAVERIADLFDDIATHGGFSVNAVLGGVMATVEGRSPIWGALTAAVASLSPATKTALVVALVLAVLLLPVTVLLVLVLLIVLAVVLAVRAAAQ